MTPNTIHLSDNLEALRKLPSDCIDCIITDSPYGLGKPPDILKVLKAWIEFGYYEVVGNGFMGKKWDVYVPQPILWKEAYRVLKPGGYLLSFFGTRTYHVGTLAIAIAGFEIRDKIDWIYGSGFPKSKSCLKPGHEPICVARKPGPLKQLNIDECRVAVSASDPELDINRKNPRHGRTIGGNGKYGGGIEMVTSLNPNGRWPANIILDENAGGEMNEQSGMSGGDKRKVKLQQGANGEIAFTTHKQGSLTPCYNDFGGASRFFYCAKASPAERAGSKHPTIKPIRLIRYLVKLYSKPGDVVADMHMGSGTTIEACILEGRKYWGVDADHDSYKDTMNRISKYNL